MGRPGFLGAPTALAGEGGICDGVGRKPALFRRATQQSFLRLLTTPTIAKAYGVSTPTNHDALSILDGFMGSSSVGSVDEPAKIFARWRSLADLPTASAKCWMDAYLAAFALQAGLKFLNPTFHNATIPGDRMLRKASLDAQAD